MCGSLISSARLAGIDVIYLSNLSNSICLFECMLVPRRSNAHTEMRQCRQLEPREMQCRNIRQAMNRSTPRIEILRKFR